MSGASAPVRALAGARSAVGQDGPDGAAPVLEVRDLSVAYSSGHESTTVVHEVSLRIHPGEVVAVVGESGSGKTTTAQAVIGLLAENGSVTAGQILLNGTDITAWSPKQLQAVRGSRIGLVPQDPNNSLNPVKRIGDSLGEVLRIHRWGDKRAIRARVVELLERVGIPDPQLRARQYPHELSGGMKQRVLIASAIALDPELIIADEATSALDVTVQRNILDLLDELRAELGTAILLVTHDLAVAADRATSVVVLKDGRVQEQGPKDEVLTAPTSAYTRQLLADAPALATAGRRTLAEAERIVAHGAGARPTLVVRDLVQEFSLGRGRDPLRAVDGVSFSVQPGTTHAIVGESGSGKTTIARAVLGFHTPTSGSIAVGGQELTGLRGEQLRQLRRVLQMVYQNPFSSLDPRQDVATIIAEPLTNFGLGDRAGRAAKVTALLDQVSLPAGLATRRPAELSGGQRQRVAIARALVLEPQLLVLDEAVSALDVSVQAQILRLLEQLQDDLGLTYLFISHDLAVVRHISHTVTVLNQGRVVESGLTESVFTDPAEPYTRALLAAIPGRLAPAGLPQEPSA
ncbi:dipeptide ABC transporter ATP-binding protein [Occultella gossypii]|uniref:ABC transporter ATP-binding protein n=1 Tax=Occultella gossypii TaxID=2800820 RepID=A0ABS7SD60_9MICO|nr:ABC transporter ATP-binding protein [Occultella gossypii]MBZ2197818.1 ABC transporter ATP-binding protein [Occultella gossypii]